MVILACVWQKQQRFASKSAQSPSLPYPLIARLHVPGGWILAILLMLAIFVLMRDLLWPIAQLTGRKAMAQIMHIPALSVGALVVAASLDAIGVFNALQPPRVHEQQLVVRNLPCAMQGLRIGVQADIHPSAAMMLAMAKPLRSAP